MFYLGLFPFFMRVYVCDILVYDIKFVVITKTLDCNNTLLLHIHNIM